MTLATVFVYLGFISLLVGIGLLAGWPWALVCGGGLMFISGVASEGRQTGGEAMTGTHRWPCRPRTIELLLCSRGMTRSQARRAMHQGMTGLTDILARDPELARALQQAEAEELARVQVETPPTPTPALARALTRLAGVLLDLAGTVDGKAR